VRVVVEVLLNFVCVCLSLGITDGGSITCVDVCVYFECVCVEGGGGGGGGVGGGCGGGFYNSFFHLEIKQKKYKGGGCGRNFFFLEA